MNPTTAFTSVSVSFIPTLNASRVRLGDPRVPERVDDQRLLGADTAWRRRHERREAHRGLDSSTCVMLWWIPNAPRKNQIVAKRNAQSQSCHVTTVRK